MSLDRLHPARSSLTWHPRLEKLRVDVRLISATNRDIESLLADGRFREDLYYRINTLTVRTPALRDRSSDIPASPGTSSRPPAGGTTGRSGQSPRRRWTCSASSPGRATSGSYATSWSGR